jgi:hypothetical protein
MIFHYLKRDQYSPEDTIQPPLTSLPLVCAEWHHEFWHENFRLLVLDQDRVDAFEEYVGRNKARQLFVERIILRIRLPDYDCTVCQKTENASTARNNDFIFILALKKFMRIMSVWELPHNGQPMRLIELDLGAYSPSDGLHGIRDARFAPGYYLGAPYEFYRDAHQRADLRPAHRCPAWMRLNDAEGKKKPFVVEKQRILSTLGYHCRPWVHDLMHWGDPVLDEIPTETPPCFARAPCIGSLTIRRHYYRHLSTDVLKALITDGLPSLHSLRHEMWQHQSYREQESYQLGYLELVSALPNRLNKLNIVYDTNNMMRRPTGQFDTSDQHYWHPLRPTDNPWDRLADELVHRTIFTELTILDISFLIDAEDLLAAFERALQHSTDAQLKHIERLTMTSSTLNPGTDSVRRRRLLHRVARLSLTAMPTLRKLELWTRSRGGDIDSMVVRNTRPSDGDCVQISGTTTATATLAIALCGEINEGFVAALRSHPHHRARRVQVYNEPLQILLKPVSLGPDGQLTELGRKRVELSLLRRGMHEESARQLEYELRAAEELEQSRWCDKEE